MYPDLVGVDLMIYTGYVAPVYRIHERYISQLELWQAWRPRLDPQKNLVAPGWHPCTPLTVRMNQVAHEAAKKFDS